MSARLATYDQTPPRWGTSSYIAIRRAGRIRMLLANALVLIGVGTMLALNPLGLQLALATDLTQPRTVARVAAIEGALEHFPYHASLPIRRVEVKADLKLLLAQSESSALDGAARDDTILVAFALSEPYSIDEDIAAQHGLELIDRTELSSFGLRIVRYRVQTNQPIGPVIANLRKDQRISSVQANVEYGLPTRSEVTKESGPGVGQQTKQYDPQGASLRRRLNSDAAVARTIGGPRAAAQSRVSGVVRAPKATKPTNRSLTYERQRQQLLDQLTVAEEARRMAMEELEELERSQTREGVEVSGGTSAAFVANRHSASPWPRDDARDTDGSQRANLRRRCIEIRVDPDGYEKALVDLCRTL